MTKTILFDKNRFADKIKLVLQEIEAETEEKLKSLMTTEAKSKVDGISIDSKTFYSIVKITPDDKTEFPAEIYEAIMNRIIAVEAPKISGGPLNEGVIIQQISSYIAELLDTKTETIKIGNTTYTLTNPFGTTNSTVTVTINDKNQYIFNWDDSNATRKSINSYMESLKEYEKENLTAVFFALLKDAKKVSGTLKELLPKWSKGLLGDKSLEYASQIKGFEFFRVLSLYQKSSNESIIKLITSVVDEIKPLLEIYSNLQNPNKKAKKLLDLCSTATGSVEGFVAWTEEIFEGSQKAIKDISKKYDDLLDKSVNLAKAISNYDGSDESLIESLSKNSSAYQDFITAYNALETTLGQSNTFFGSVLEDYTSYKITDVHNEIITDNRASVYGTNENDTIDIQGNNVKVYGGEGNDNVITSGRHVTLIGEQGNDHFLIREITNKNYVDAGADDDTILSYGNNNTINGGSGNDNILVSVYEGFGIENEIRGGDGSDTISVKAVIENTVLGEAGNDFIHISEEANGNTIIGGTGNDTITIDNADRNFIVYSEGDGDDTIFGFDSNDTLYIAEGVFSRSTIETDVIVSVGDGSILLKDAAEKNLNIIKPLTFDDLFKDMQRNKIIFGTQQSDNIENTVDGANIDADSGDDEIYNTSLGTNVIINGGDGADIVNNSGKKVTINGGNGNDSISNGGWWYENGVDKWHDGGSNVTIDGGTGIDTIINYEGNSVKIDGGADDDSIYNWGSSVIIDGGDGNDSISNLNSYSLNVTINGGTGDDAIKNSGGNATIDGGAGNDLISLDAYADKNVILYNKDAGNDSIVGFNSTSTLQLITGIVDKIISDGKDILMTIENNTITLEDGFKIGSMSIIDENGTKITLPVMEINGLEEQDSFSNNWDNAIIKGIDGNDSIKNGGSSVTIDGGAGDDTITNSSVASNVSINSGLGNDSISNSGSNVTIVGGVGNDHIGNRGSSVTIKGEEGNDYISNSGDSVTIDGGADDDTISSNGNDYVINSGDSVSISGGTGNDSIYNYGDNVIIDGGEGENSISNGDYWNNGGSSVSINGGSDNNYIYNRGASSIIDSGEGNDSINNDSVSPSVIIVGGAGNDSISNHGDFVTMDGGDGNDTIRNDGKCSKIFSDEGNDSIDSWGLNVTINSGTGDDFIENKGNNATIDSGVGNDAIYNSGDMVTIATGAGKDTIYNYFGNRVIIDGGAGNDSIDNNYGGNVTINSGDGDDYIQNWCGSSAIINGGDGNDYIRNYNGDSVTVDSGIGDDSIYNEDSSNVIIDARMGNDSIRNDSVASNVTIDGGEGNDFIVNYGSTVTINGGTGDDFISLDSYQAKNNLIIYNINDGNDTINGIDGNDLLSISGGSYSTTKSGNDIVVMVGDGSIILKDAASLSTVNIDGEEGNLTELTFNNKTDSVITLPAQTEIVDASKRTRPIKITGNTLANSLFGGKGNDTLDGVEGDNTLTGGKGKDTFIFSGGKNIITDYETKDKISVGGGLSYVSFAVDGGDVILSFNDSDSLTIIKGAGKAINMNSTINFYTSDGLFDKAKKSITLATEVETFNAKNYSQLATIDGSSTDIVEIIGNSKANSIVAGTSGSTLNGGKGKDTLVGGDSSDIFVYSKGDGKDVIENYGAGDKISLGSDVAIRGVMIKNGNTIFKIGSGSVTVNDTTKVTLTSDGNDTIFSDGLFIIGDSIKVIGDYKDTIDLNEYSNITTIDASLDNKKLTINGDDEDNLLIGGRGKDKIYGNAGNDTLWGGKKNDTLYGGDGDDTFIFQAGNGNDVIADYQSGELLQILNKRGNEGDFKKSIFKNDTLTLIIQGGGKVILKDVDSSTDFNINGESYHVEGESLV